MIKERTNRKDSDVRLIRSVNFDLALTEMDVAGISYSNLYRDIRKWMEANGFEHSQYSGYVTSQPMTERMVISRLDKLFKKFDYLDTYAKEFSITTMYDTYDYLEVHDKLKQIEDHVFENDIEPLPTTIKIGIKPFKDIGERYHRITAASIRQFIQRNDTVRIGKGEYQFKEPMTKQDVCKLLNDYFDASYTDYDMSKYCSHIYVSNEKESYDFLDVRNQVKVDLQNYADTLDQYDAKKAVFFDLMGDVSVKNRSHSASHAVGYFLESNDFVHSQGSGYFSPDNMTEMEVFSFLEKIAKRNPDFIELAKSVHVSSVGQNVDYLKVREKRNKTLDYNKSKQRGKQADDEMTLSADIESEETLVV